MIYANAATATARLVAIPYTYSNFALTKTNIFAYIYKMKFEITYYSEILQQDILRFPSGIRARYFLLTDRMEKFGPNLGMPHTRAMGDGLFELRLRAKEGIARVFFCTIVDRKIVMLHSFVKKSQKTPKRDLNIAIQRMREIKQ